MGFSAKVLQNDRFFDSPLYNIYTLGIKAEDDSTYTPF